MLTWCGAARECGRWWSSVALPRPRPRAVPRGQHRLPARGRGRWASWCGPSRRADSPGHARPPPGYPDLAGRRCPVRPARLKAYASMSVQFSRGCPYSCEFCDVIEIFGHTPRVKSPAQVVAELDALLALGWRGSCSSSTTTSSATAGGALAPPALERWQRRTASRSTCSPREHQPGGRPGLVAAMVRAGFSAVFVASSRVAPPSRRPQAAQLLLDPGVAVTTHAAGLEVMPGLIVGFDSDDGEIFERQRAFVAALPMPVHGRDGPGSLNRRPPAALGSPSASAAALRSTSGLHEAPDRPNFRPAIGRRTTAGALSAALRCDRARRISLFRPSLSLYGVVDRSAHARIPQSALATANRRAAAQPLTS